MVIKFLKIFIFQLLYACELCKMFRSFVCFIFAMTSQQYFILQNKVVVIGQASLFVRRGPHVGDTLSCKFENNFWFFFRDFCRIKWTLSLINRIDSVEIRVVAQYIRDGNWDKLILSLKDWIKKFTRDADKHPLDTTSMFIYASFSFSFSNSLGTSFISTDWLNFTYVCMYVHKSSFFTKTHLSFPPDLFVKFFSIKK